MEETLGSKLQNLSFSMFPYSVREKEEYLLKKDIAGTQW